MSEVLKKVGYCTITKRVRLYVKHIEYLKYTEKIYNETILKYYDLLLQNIEFLNLSNQNCLRELEKLTITATTNQNEKEFLEQEVPAYLRRAAINHAIGAVRIYQAQLKRYSENEKNKNGKPSKTTSFSSSIVLYKGMYKIVSENQIKLKLFNGNSWQWYLAKTNQNCFTEHLEILSPTVVIKPRYVMLHIPIKMLVEDVSSVKERINQSDIKICAVAFSNTDSFAICSVLDGHGRLMKTKFIKGGKEYKDRCGKILAKIKKDRNENKVIFGKGDHKTYWEKLNNISDFYAHNISKQIVDFCTEERGFDNFYSRADRRF